MHSASLLNYSPPIPSAFNGPAQTLLFKRYGDPRSKEWAKQWLTSWAIQKSFQWFPEKSIIVHRHFKPLLNAAFRELEYQGLHKEIISCDTDYIIRFVTGSNTILSLHSWGAAIDMNMDGNPVGSSGSWSRSFTDVMRENDIFCGQDWIGRKEPTHFAMLNG